MPFYKRLKRLRERPRTFKLMRLKDISGVSGTGVIAEGIVFHDKQTVISWYGQHHSLGIHPSIEEVEAIHGHDGATQIIWDK